MQWRHLPNLITVFRIILVCPLFWLISEDRFGAALFVALIAGISDALDGYIAKRYGWQSRLGGMLDPIADKLLLVAGFVALTLNGSLPPWLLLIVLGRDVLIVCGAVAYHNLIDAFTAAPSRLSKLTTLVQILCVLFELLRLSLMPGLAGRDAMYFTTAALTVASGIHYVVVWSMRAWQAMRQRANKG